MCVVRARHACCVKLVTHGMAVVRRRPRGRCPCGAFARPSPHLSPRRGRVPPGRPGRLRSPDRQGSLRCMHRHGAGGRGCARDSRAWRHLRGACVADRGGADRDGHRARGRRDPRRARLGVATTRAAAPRARRGARAAPRQAGAAAVRAARRGVHRGSRQAGRAAASRARRTSTAERRPSLFRSGRRTWPRSPGRREPPSTASSVGRSATASSSSIAGGRSSSTPRRYAGARVSEPARPERYPPGRSCPAPTDRLAAMSIGADFGQAHFISGVRPLRRRHRSEHRARDLATRAAISISTTPFPRDAGRGRRPKIRSASTRRSPPVLCVTRSYRPGGSRDKPARRPAHQASARSTGVLLRRRAGPIAVASRLPRPGARSTVQPTTKRQTEASRTASSREARATRVGIAHGACPVVEPDGTTGL